MKVDFSYFLDLELLRKNSENDKFSLMVLEIPKFHFYFLNKN